MKALANVAWQQGYAAFSIGASGVDDTIAYIRNQEEQPAPIAKRWNYSSGATASNTIQLDWNHDGVLSSLQGLVSLSIVPKPNAKALGYFQQKKAGEAVGSQCR